MKKFIQNLLREGLKRDKTCEYFDLSSLNKYVEFNKPLYSLIEKRKTAILHNMAPKQYIYKIAHGFGGLSWEDVVDSSMVSKENVTKYSEDMLKGDKFPVPYFTRDSSYQEGRHRALAAIKLECESIPVIEFIEINYNEFEKVMKRFKGKSKNELNDLFIQMGFKNGISMLGYESLQRRYEYGDF